MSCFWKHLPAAYPISKRLGPRARGMVSDTAAALRTYRLPGIRRSLKRAVFAGFIFALVQAPVSGRERTLPAGEQQASVAAMRVVDNTIAQRRERYFGIALQEGDGYELGARHAHTYTIIDNDFPRVRFLAGQPHDGYHGEEQRVYITIDGATAADYPIVIDARVDGAQPGDYEVFPVHIPAAVPFEEKYLVARIFPERSQTDQDITITLLFQEEEIAGEDAVHQYTVFGDVPRCGCHGRDGMGTAMFNSLKQLFLR